MQNLKLQQNSQPVPYDDSDISGALDDSHLVRMWLSGHPENTVRAYQADSRAFRLHVCKPLRSTTVADLIAFAESLAYQSTATQHRRLSSIKSLFSFAMTTGYIAMNPAAVLKLPKPQNNRASKLLNVEQVRAVIRSAKPGRDRLILRVLYISGIRCAELVRLNAEDINATLNGHALSIIGKGQKQRTIALPPILAADLISHRDSGAIFRTVRDNSLNASDVYRIVRRAGEAASYKIHPHLLRHAHASHSLDAGAPIHVVKESLGHASLATTSIYSHAKPNDSSALYLEGE